MIEKWYSEDPVNFKNAWLSENNPKGIIITLPDFKNYIRPVGNENPKSLGWYEHNNKKKKYILTTDEIVVNDKMYFVQGSDLIYTDQDIDNDSFSLKQSIQSGSNVDFMGCIASTLEFKVKNDFKYLKDQHINASLTVNDGNILWKIKVFTGYVNELVRDKSRDIVRTVRANDYMAQLLDDYDVTDWYVWQYGDSNELTDIKHSIYDLRNSFWDYIANSGTVYSPNGVEIKKKNEGWDQVQDASLINDSIEIPKTLNVSPIDYDPNVSTNKISGADYFVKGTYGNIIKSGWDVTDLVARSQVISLGLLGSSFSYDGQSSTHYRKYMDDCDKKYENTGVKESGIMATVYVPKEPQEKIRETQITAATVLQAICQFNGVFGIFNGEGHFEYISLNINNPLEITEEYQMDLKHSDFKMPKLTGVSIFDKTSAEYSNDIIHTEYGDVKNGQKGSALAYYPNDRTKIEGDDANPFIIDDNFLLNSFTQSDAMTMAERLYNQVSNLTMVNCEMSIKAMPWLKCGQAICYYAPTENTLFPSEDLFPSESLFPSDFEKVTSVIMTYDISGTGLVKGKITCKAEEVKGDIVHLNEIISNEMFQRKIGDTRSYSTFLQTANQIKLEVRDDVDKLGASINVELQKIELRIDGPEGLVSRIELNERNINLQSERITNECVNYDVYASDQISLSSKILEIVNEETIIKANSVTFEDLKSGTKTKINGGSIITGTLNGDAIIAGTVSCDRIKMGSVTLDGQTYDMAWRKAMLYDTHAMTVMHQLGLTIKPDSRSKSLYFHYHTTNITTSEAGWSNIDQIVIDNNATHSGSDWHDVTIGMLVTDDNILINSTTGSNAYGAESATFSGNAVAFEESNQSGAAGYRLIMASEARPS